MSYLKYRIVLLMLVISTMCGVSTTSAQSESEPSWAFTGYVKTLQTIISLDAVFFGQSLISDNLLHHRLNSNWYINDYWTFKGGLRTRLLFGELTNLQQDLRQSLDMGGNDWLNLSLINVGTDVIVHSILDRAYFEYARDNIEIRVGRQRVNWGVNTIWNPNDLFNTFSFADFDYEERPGSDAIRIQYYTGLSSSIEIAVKGADSFNEAVGAVLWKFNQSNYDFQLLAGYAQEDLVIGGGWAGSIGDVGFKGEFSWFNNSSVGRTNALTATLSWDYIFSNQLFVVAGVLYNDSGRESGGSLLTFDLSARNLHPYRWATLLQTSYPISPLLNVGIAFIYSPVAENAGFINPTLTYSLGQNLDVDFVSQFSFQESTQFGSANVNAYFLRVKWSY